jgi:hypothetical protein
VRRRGVALLKRQIFPPPPGDDPVQALRAVKKEEREGAAEFPPELERLLLRTIESPYPDVQRDLAMWLGTKTDKYFVKLHLVLARSSHPDLAYVGMSALLRGHEDISDARQEVIDVFAEALADREARRPQDVVSLMGNWVSGAERVRFLAQVLATSTSTRAHRRVVRMLERDDERIELGADGLVPPKRIAELLSRREPLR